MEKQHRKDFDHFIELTSVACNGLNKCQVLKELTDGLLRIQLGYVGFYKFVDFLILSLAISISIWLSE